MSQAIGDTFKKKNEWNVKKIASEVKSNWEISRYEEKK